MVRLFLLPTASLVFLISILGPNTPTSGQKVDVDSRHQGPALIHGREFEGVIFPARMKPFVMYFPRGVRYWTPSESDVLMAENELVPFLQKSKDPRVAEILKTLKTYKRQYAGVILSDQKQIYINVLCETFALDWRRRPVVVSDGGPCYFNLRFSTDTKTFSDFYVNGRA
jgi:hypothetical protein